MDDAGPDREFDGPLEGRYANYFKIGYNAFEFLLDFGQWHPEDAAERLHTRIITGPMYVKTFLRLLGDAVRHYETTFGAIEGER